MTNKIFHSEEFDVYFRADEVSSNRLKNEAFEALFNLSDMMPYLNPATLLEVKKRSLDVIVGLSIARWGRGEYAILKEEDTITSFRCRVYPIERLISH